MTRRKLFQLFFLIYTVRLQAFIPSRDAVVGYSPNNSNIKQQTIN